MQVRNGKKMKKNDFNKQIKGPTDACVGRLKAPYGAQGA